MHWNFFLNIFFIHFTYIYITTQSEHHNLKKKKGRKRKHSGKGVREKEIERERERRRSVVERKREAGMSKATHIQRQLIIQYVHIHSQWSGEKKKQKKN